MAAAPGDCSDGGPGGDPLRAAAGGRLRWAVNSKEWRPEGDFDGPEFQYLLSLIQEPEERETVTRFHRFKDQKRGLISRLLCRRAAAATLGMRSFRGIDIARTKGRKPFLRAPRPLRPDLANFNFNVSHEGDWVVLASEPICVCGIDVAAPEEVRNLGTHKVNIWRDFLDQLTCDEWAMVRKLTDAAPKRQSEDEDPPENFVFSRFWSAKEAFVKARGDGIGFTLDRCGFSFETLEEDLGDGRGPAYVATVEVDERPAPMWRMYQHLLHPKHWVTVARGPTADVQDARGEMLRTLPRRSESFAPEDWQRELERESPRFDEVPIGFLVPEDDVAGYVRAGGRPWALRR